jgi:hypothetical protein
MKTDERQVLDNFEALLEEASEDSFYQYRATIRTQGGKIKQLEQRLLNLEIRLEALQRFLSLKEKQ